MTKTIRGRDRPRVFSSKMQGILRSGRSGRAGSGGSAANFGRGTLRFSGDSGKIAVRKGKTPAQIAVLGWRLHLQTGGMSFSKRIVIHYIHSYTAYFVEICDLLATAFRCRGYCVCINEPYTGSIVPLQFLNRDFRVRSVMIEVNRGLYLDNACRKNRMFPIVAQAIQSAFLRLAAKASLLDRP